MIFNINTGDLTDVPIDETIITGKRNLEPKPKPEPDKTKIESGSFLVSFD